jgi:hypothetical protein
MNCEERLFWDHKFTGSWSTCSSIPGKRFPITFYSDVPVGQGIPPWSHPGNLLYQETLDFASVNETKYGTIDHGANIIETVFQYNATLPTPFGQDASIIYWLSIQAIDDDVNLYNGAGMKQRPFGMTMQSSGTNFLMVELIIGIYLPIKIWPLK